MRAHDKSDPRKDRDALIPSWKEAAFPEGNETGDNDDTEIHVTIERVEWIEERVAPDGARHRQKRSLRARKTAVRLNLRWLLVGSIIAGAMLYKPDLAEPLLKLFKIMIRAG